MKTKDPRWLDEDKITTKRLEELYEGACQPEAIVLQAVLSEAIDGLTPAEALDDAKSMLDEMELELRRRYGYSKEDLARVATELNQERAYKRALSA